MNVLLVQPHATFPSRFAPLGLSYLAGNLDEKHNVFGLDMNFLGNVLGAQATQQELLRTLQENEIDVVGISVLEETIDAAREVARAARDNATIVAGGYLPTLAPSAIDFADFVIRGEGERPFNALVNALDSGGSPPIIKGLEGELSAINIEPDLNSLRPPRRDIFPSSNSRQKYSVAAVVASRGCVFDCGYCSAKQLYGRRYRSRSMENLAVELDALFADEDLECFRINDEQFFGFSSDDRARALSILSYVANSVEGRDRFKMALEGRADQYVKFMSEYPHASEIFAKLAAKDSSLVEDLQGSKDGLSISLGIEALHQPLLDFYDKELTVETNLEAIRLLQQSGHSYSLFMLPFHAELPFNDAKENILAYLRHVSDVSVYHTKFFLSNLSERVVPYKGTRFINQWEAKGILDTREDIAGYRFTDRRTGVLYHFMNLLTSRALQQNFEYGSVRQGVLDLLEVCERADVVSEVSTHDAPEDFFYVFERSGRDDSR